MEKKSRYNLLIVLAACVGSFLYGNAISIFATTLGKPQFFTYMGLDVVGPGADFANSMTAVWNCMLYVGAVIGGISYSFVSDRFGRKTPMVVGCVFAFIGSALQAGCVNIAMCAVSRVIDGVGIGMLLPAIPLYQAEVAPPHSRGLLVGLHGSALGFGNMFAQWMGCAFFYAGGQVAWRAPLAIQCLWPAILFGLTLVMPESPRWLYAHGHEERALKTLIKLHKDKNDDSDTFARHEFSIIKAQTDLDMEKGMMTTWQALKISSVRKRFIIGFLAMMGTQCSGLLVLLTYSPTIYEGLGFSPFMTNVMAAIWSTFNGLGNLGGAVIADRVGRRRQLISGYAGVLVCLIGATVLTKLYAGTASAGSKAAVFFIFGIIVLYTLGIEAASFVYASEIFPTQLRAQGVAFSMQGLFLSSILWTAVAAPAFKNIGWRFYCVFIATDVMMILTVYFLFPETKGYTLEQLSAVFGDEVVGDDVDEQPAEKGTETIEAGEKGDLSHIEYDGTKSL
ncbi:general substrate transporter [Mytilinidion resinicola]|uniref:General substrate transporter n=1 Tax=Mytilinidion resinicola TaxID=574789 RepID=A0A6A6YBF6_9PEZI|nr:general substrate transporter [Mytilinidion resinicola]KAF2806030.1 general substrate transporter [Mytilinidion resinicola]